MVGIISVAVHAPPPKKNPESAPAPRPDQLGSFKNWSDHTSCDFRPCVSSDHRVVGPMTLNRWPCLFLLSFIDQIKGDLKEPTKLPEKG